MENLGGGVVSILHGVGAVRPEQGQDNRCLMQSRPIRPCQPPFVLPSHSTDNESETTYNHGNSLLHLKKMVLRLKKTSQKQKTILTIG